MATLDEELNQISTSPDSDDVGTAVSMLAAVPSGLFKIFEGVASLGATLLDLGVDKDRAEAVEAYFDKINPFDELAEATAAGKITELIVNIGIPGGAAFKIGSGLTKATLRAKKAGTYLSRGERATRYAKGAGLSGIAEGMVVGDVEEAGSFGDWLGGPTKIDRESDEASTELLNRIKFGIEGALFTGAIGGAGEIISRLRNQVGTGKALKGFNKWLDQNVGRRVRARGPDDPNVFDLKNKRRGAVDSDTLKAQTDMRELDDIFGKIEKKYKKVVVDKVEPNVKKQILKEGNDLFMSGTGKDGKFRPLFGTVDEIRKDPITGVPFQSGFGQLKALKFDAPLPKEVPAIDPKTGQVILDPKTGKEIMDSVKVIDPVTQKPKKLYNVEIEPMSDTKKMAFRKKLEDTYKASPDDVTDLLNIFTDARTRIGNLFTGYGRLLNPEAITKFQDLLPKVIDDLIDRGYNVFKENKGQLTVAKNIPPVNTLIKETVKEFQQIASSKINPKTGKPFYLSDDLAMEMVNEIWRKAELPKGIMLEKGEALASVRFRTMPNFIRKSVADEVTDISKRDPKSANLSQVTGVAKPVILKLLGKSENPMASIMEGTSNLSAQLRSMEFFNNTVKKNNIYKRAWNRWNDGYQYKDAVGKMITVPARTGTEPPLPFIANTHKEAQKFWGASADDIEMIVPPRAEREIDRFVDQPEGKGILAPVDTLEKELLEKRSLGKDELETIVNPLAGKYALTDQALGFRKVDEGKKKLGTLIYENSILYPKALSQMSKTVFGPFTHTRNFLSATAFAAANGILPFGNTKDVKAAWQALQVGGPFGTRKLNAFYQELLELGVVNSNVRLGDLRRLLEDVDFGKTLNNLNSDFYFHKFIKGMNKIKRAAQDAYTAEDDFWKIFTYLGEKSRLTKAFKDKGMRFGQEFTDMNGVKRLFNEQTLKEMSADLVKNNVPNYAFVSEFIKGIRRWPVGNFVAFPAEIMRTGTNIIETALKEINYKTIINPKDGLVAPLRARGIQRLTGMALTTAALPAGIVTAMQALYDVSQDELNAMRRYVADWSKNSTLIPFKDDDGKLSYIDFSHLNAYDTLTRPIQTVLNAVEQGRADNDGIMDDFILGLIESTKELGAPFISESIWTEALQDIAPVLGRSGVDREGRPIWNEKDSRGDKLAKAVGHVAEAMAPLNWNQLSRLGLSMYPSDSKGRFNERGQDFTLGNEAAGIFGMRRVEVNPKKSFNYKVTDYKKGVRNSRNLFTAATLKGGVVTPTEVVDAYINTNRALYEVSRNLYEDMRAAQILGMGEEAISFQMNQRGEQRAFNALIQGQFRPFTISNKVRQLFELRSQELGVVNPFEAAQDVLDRIKEALEMVPLSGDLFPDLKNPLKELPLVGAITNMLDNTPVMPMDLNTQNTGAAIAQNANNRFGNVTTNVDQASQYAALWPGDSYGQINKNKLQAKALNQRPKTNIGLG